MVVYHHFIEICSILQRSDEILRPSPSAWELHKGWKSQEDWKNNSEDIEKGNTFIEYLEGGDLFELLGLATSEEDEDESQEDEDESEEDGDGKENEVVEQQKESRAMRAKRREKIRSEKMEMSDEPEEEPSDKKPKKRKGKRGKAKAKSRDSESGKSGKKRGGNEETETTQNVRRSSRLRLSGKKRNYQEQYDEYPGIPPLEKGSEQGSEQEIAEGGADEYMISTEAEAED